MLHEKVEPENRWGRQENASRQRPPAALSPGEFVVHSLKITWWIWVFPVALVAALATRSMVLLDYVHIICAILWTGTDLFMGFVIGPILRSLPPEGRGMFVRRLMNRYKNVAALQGVLQVVIVFVMVHFVV